MHWFDRQYTNYPKVLSPNSSTIRRKKEKVEILYLEFETFTSNDFLRKFKKDFHH